MCRLVVPLRVLKCFCFRGSVQCSNSREAGQDGTAGKMAIFRLYADINIYWPTFWCRGNYNALLLTTNRSAFNYSQDVVFLSCSVCNIP